MEFKAEDFKDDEGFADYIKTVTGSAVEDQTAELKAKIDTLIGEKRSVTDKMKEFEGLDVTAAREALDMIQKNDMVRRIADGKFDEVLAEKTDQLRTQFEDDLGTVKQTLEEEKLKSSALATALDNTRIDAALRKAAVKAGVLAEALDDVIARGRPIFSVSGGGEVEARDAEGNMIKIEDKILTTARWIETLPRHYWPSSDSANISGSSSGAELDEKLSAALKSGDMALYRKLRKAK